MKKGIPFLPPSFLPVRAFQFLHDTLLICMTMLRMCQREEVLSFLHYLRYPFLCAHYVEKEDQSVSLTDTVQVTVVFSLLVITSIVVVVAVVALGHVRHARGETVARETLRQPQALRPLLMLLLDTEAGGREAVRAARGQGARGRRRAVAGQLLGQERRSRGPDHRGGVCLRRRGERPRRGRVSVQGRARWRVEVRAEAEQLQGGLGLLWNLGGLVRGLQHVQLVLDLLHLHLDGAKGRQRPAVALDVALLLFHGFRSFDDLVVLVSLVQKVQRASEVAVLVVVELGRRDYVVSFLVQERVQRYLVVSDVSEASSGRNRRRSFHFCT